MEFEGFRFGVVEIDGKIYEHDVVIDRGTIRKRKKGPSKPLRARYGHTPLSTAEDVPWECRSLVIGSGADGALPVDEGVIHEADRRGVRLVVMPTAQALETLRGAPPDTNAILHVTC